MRFDPKDLEKDFDLVIIGGGINGAGVARDAAERGLKVLLLEKDDFASGTTGHSTRLIHGGLRYLEFLELGLVFESLQEREILLKNYPNLVKPLGILIPHYEGNRVSKFLLKIGMWLYDLLSFGKGLEHHRDFSNEKIKEKKLGLRLKELDGGFYYFDGQVNFAERLCLENILTAESKGAICINHAKAFNIKCEYKDGKNYVESVEFEDLLNPDENNRSYEAKAKYILNLSGPWVDLTNKLTNCKENYAPIKKLIGGTKGSHIVVKAFYNAPSTHGVYTEAHSDGRPFFILPMKLGENDNYCLVGTTDIFTEESLDDMKISEKEIEYLLSELNYFYPEAKLDQNDIVKTFCGVRPLPHVEKGKSEGSVTRRHFIRKHGKDSFYNLFSGIGGKLTTFRSFSKEMVDLISKEKCCTKDNSTIGCNFEGKSFNAYVSEKLRKYSKQYSVDLKTVKHLLKIYGSRTNDVLDLTINHPELKEPIEENYEDIKAQIVFALQKEKAYTLDDILNRRLSIGLLKEKHSEEAVRLVAKYIAVHHNLSKDEEEAMIAKFLNKKEVQI